MRQWAATYAVLIAVGMSIAALVIATRLIAEMIGITF